MLLKLIYVILVYVMLYLMFNELKYDFFFVLRLVECYNLFL